jgi:2-phospho-L-lactate/phosphoenolpyruvate guanylyltransferase
VLVPVKAFGAAKARLAPSLDEAARASLARSMADRVLDAAAPMTVYVACDDEAVATWATARGAVVVPTEGLDLNGSIARGIEVITAETVVIAHADLPFARSLTWLSDFPGATVVPDRRDDGTNVLCVPTDCGFTPVYGRGSFPRHLSQLLALGLDVRVARDPALQWDVDTPGDLPDDVLLAASA